MKKSELKFVGTYLLTPSSWGNQYYVIFDLRSACEAVSKLFGTPCTPDDDPNDKPQKIEVWEDTIGNRFIVDQDNEWRYCDSSDFVKDGLGEIWGTWQPFDEERDL